jgi:ribosome-associated translation inhibitor RaiA
LAFPSSFSFVLLRLAQLKGVCGRSMNIHWSFRNCEDNKETARSYWREKQPRLERLLSRFPPESCRLKLFLFHHQSRKAWELRAVLTLPTGTLVTEEEGDALYALMDKAADELARQIRRRSAVTRKEHVRRRRRPQSAVLTPSRFLRTPDAPFTIRP